MKYIYIYLMNISDSNDTNDMNLTAKRFWRIISLCQILLAQKLFALFLKTSLNSKTFSFNPLLSNSRSRLSLHVHTPFSPYFFTSFTVFFKILSLSFFELIFNILLYNICARQILALLYLLLIQYNQRKTMCSRIMWTHKWLFEKGRVTNNSFNSITNFDQWPIVKTHYQILE